MTKVELLAEANRIGVLVHHRWTNEEIKAAIQEHRMENDPSTVMKSITKLTFDELKVKATRLGVSYGDRITKGNLIRLIRDHTSTPDQELMKIERVRVRRDPQHLPGVGIQRDSHQRDSSPGVGAICEVVRRQERQGDLRQPGVHRGERLATFPNKSVGSGLQYWADEDSGLERGGGHPDQSRLPPREGARRRTWPGPQAPQSCQGPGLPRGRSL